MIKARLFMRQQTIARFLLHSGKQVNIMPAKKVVIVIVEGPTDEDALGVIFQQFFDNTLHISIGSGKGLRLLGLEHDVLHGLHLCGRTGQTTL